MMCAQMVCLILLCFDPVFTLLDGHRVRDRDQTDNWQCAQWRCVKKSKEERIRDGMKMQKTLRFVL